MYTVPIISLSLSLSQKKKNSVIVCGLSFKDIDFRCKDILNLK